MNRQRKVLITTTYNEMGIIIDTKAEELDLSAQPECKTGRWEKVRSANYGTDFRCSECHRYRFHNGEMRKEYKYCPHCGAKMEVETE